MNEQNVYTAECAVVGSALTNEEALEQVISCLKAEDFNDYFLSEVFLAIVKMKDKDPKIAIDFITVSDFMGRSIADFQGLIECDYFSNNIVFYIEIVRKESERRKVRSLINMALTKINERQDDFKEYLANGLAGIENASSCVIEPYRASLSKTLEQIDVQFRSGKKLIGISTGFHEIDFYTNGLQAGQFIVLAARTSVGKTMLMLNIADNVGLDGKDGAVVIFSLEMPRSQLHKRSLARAAKVEGNLIFNGQLAPEHWINIGKGVEKLNQSKVIIIDDASMSVYKMRTYCRQIKNKYGLRAVFYDYIGLMEGQGENETLRLAEISRGSRAIAKDFEVPVFAVCQLNRAPANRADNRPLLSDIRQCGNIEQDADVAMLLFENKDGHILNIAKNRNGKTGEIHLLLRVNFFEFVEKSWSQ